MADSLSISEALRRLAARRVVQVACVAVLASSQSELYDQFAYVLGKRPAPSQEFLDAMKRLEETPGHRHAPQESRPVKAPAPLELSRAMDDHPYAVRILLDRARQISRQPQKEAVLLVSHGPYTDEAEGRWMAAASNAAFWVEKLGDFSTVKAFNLRDDSPEKIREARAKAMRAWAAARQKEGKTILVVGHLISFNGIESHISRALNGVPYKMSKEGILPHPLAARWALEQVEALAGASNDE